jgi:protein ImuA
MIPDRADIIAKLQRQIMPLEGFKPVPNPVADSIGLDAMAEAFPGGQLPLGAVHEFLMEGKEDKAATAGFIAGIVTHLMRRPGHLIWVTAERTIFPHSLKLFSIDAERIIFIEAKTEKDILWVTEEALKCESVAAVVSEVKHLSFTASRRLQLAVEQSRVTGFVLRDSPHNVGTTACIARWKITPMATVSEGTLPGLGFPRWQVELQKIRNGKPGTWEFEWARGRFRHVAPVHEHYYEAERKAV